MLTKKECLKALQNAQEKTIEIEDYNSISISSFCLIEKELSVFKQLIQEHFELAELFNKQQDELDKYKHEYFAMCDLFEDPQPYKFEELHEGMWMWDDKNKLCLKVIGFYGVDMHVKAGFRLYEIDYYVEFKENRFYPVTKAMQYQSEG